VLIYSESLHILGFDGFKSMRNKLYPYLEGKIIDAKRYNYFDMDYKEGEHLAFYWFLMESIANCNA